MVMDNTLHLSILNASPKERHIKRLVVLLKTRLFKDLIQKTLCIISKQTYRTKSKKTSGISLIYSKNNSGHGVRVMS